MSTTIFCSFDQQDLADLAVGTLRASSLEIRSIHYIGGFKPRRERELTVIPPSNVAALGFAGGTMGNMQAQVPPAAFGLEDTQPPLQMPSQPVTVKIVCSDSSATAVKSRLINMRAYQIITTR